MSHPVEETPELYRTEGRIVSQKTPFSIPSVDLLRSVLRSRELAEYHRREGRWDLYTLLIFELFEVTSKFAELGQALDIAQDYAKKTMKTYPDHTFKFISYVTSVYHERMKTQPQTITTRLAYSRLRMQAANILLEKKDRSLANIRALLYHPIPVIHELNFIIVLIKNKHYLKATLFLTDLAPLFVGDRIDVRLALPYYELACLGYLGQKSYSKAFEALDRGYSLVQKLPKTSFQAVRFLTFFEKVIALFDKSNEGQRIDIPDLEALFVPGYIFDKIFLSQEYAPDIDAILVEL